MTALCTIGPRQITACSGLTMKPIDISLMPYFSSGNWRRLRIDGAGTPIMIGTLGP